MKKYSPSLHGRLAIVLTVVLLFAAGCQQPQSNASTGSANKVSYVGGGLETTLNGSYGDIISATNEAITQLDFSLPRQKADGFSDTLDADTAHNSHVHIVVTKITDNLTDLTIRIDYAGDSQMSETILNTIISNFQALPHTTTI